LGTAFLDRVREVFARIAANPQLHATVYQDIRKAVVPRFPYIVLYKEEAGEVVVIAVFHTARDPAIWQGRA
jgi:plasmid stabilization system protein ParE